MNKEEILKNAIGSFNYSELPNGMKTLIFIAMNTYTNQQSAELQAKVEGLEREVEKLKGEINQAFIDGQNSVGNSYRQ